MNNTIHIRKENENYILIYQDIKEICYIGKLGLTKEKKEGDLKTPIGTFKLGKVFGTHKRESLSLDNNFEYTRINENLFWVDDPRSKYYNKLVDTTKTKKDWTSAESLFEYKEPYEYAIEILSNPKNIPGKGSAIFIHCKQKEYTAGCISISKETMKELLKRINPNTKIEIGE